MINNFIKWISCVCLLFFLTGCAAHLKQRELERVAKDWAMTIRASQVIPIYPLNADIQPGDIFLVQTPISKETETYKKKGYLPLDLQFARLNLSQEYKTFYQSDYWNGIFANNPFNRPLRSPSSGTAPKIGKLTVSSPSVAFPNYTFQISAGGGLQVAIPISSVPLGLGLMGTNAASGSVDLNEAHTYGLSVEEILPKLRLWAVRNRAELRRMAKSNLETIFLRVVSRVFLVGKVTVSLTNADTSSGGVDIGTPKQIDLTALQTSDPEKVEQTADAYKKAAAAFKDALNNLNAELPGGSIRIAHASRRSVTMEEAFEEPKVVGYLGFDVQIYDDGSIGSVIATFQKLENNIKLPEPIAFGPDENSKKIRTYLDESENNVTVLKKWLEENNYKSIPIAVLLNGDLPELRTQVVKSLNIDK